MKTPNKKLQYERQSRGWSQKRVADFLDTSKEMISRWKCGERRPSPFSQEKLCLLFGKSAEELGFLKDDSLLDRTQKYDMLTAIGESASDLVLTALQQSEIEKACSYAERVVTLASQHPSGFMQNKVLKLRQQLVPFAHVNAVKKIQSSIAEIH